MYSVPPPTFVYHILHFRNLKLGTFVITFHSIQGNYIGQIVQDAERHLGEGGGDSKRCVCDRSITNYSLDHFQFHCALICAKTFQRTNILVIRMCLRQKGRWFLCHMDLDHMAIPCEMGPYRHDMMPTEQDDMRHD